MRVEIRGKVADSHPALAGHFPGNPIVPGALILCEVLQAASAIMGDHFAPSSIPLARFHSPLRPGEEYLCTLERVDASTLKYRMTHDARLVASGTLKSQPRAPRLLR